MTCDKAAGQMNFGDCVEQSMARAGGENALDAAGSAARPGSRCPSMCIPALRLFMPPAATILDMSLIMPRSIRQSTAGSPCGSVMRRALR